MRVINVLLTYLLTSVVYGMPLLCSCLRTEGWPGWDDLLHTKTVNSPTGGSPIQVLTRPDVEQSLVRR